MASSFTDAEVAAIKHQLANQGRPQIRTVMGRAFDMSKVRAPMVSEDDKHSMYANPRALLKDKTKPAYDNDPKNGVEYIWELKERAAILANMREHRIVTMDELDPDSPFYGRLDAPTNVYVNKEQVQPVSSGGLILIEVHGQAAYKVKRYGADKYLWELKDKQESDFRRDALGSGVRGVNRADYIDNPDWDPKTQSLIADPATWGGGNSSKFV